jgi:hypothetical protein
LDLALAAALLGFVMYLLMRIRRMTRLRLAESNEPTVKRNYIVIKHSFDEEVSASPEMTATVPYAATE